MNQNVYINSVEASHIHNHMNRGKYIKNNYVGMMPHSLELIKLNKVGLKSFTSKKHPNKVISNDIINVKFNQKVRSADQLIKENNKKLAEENDDKKKLELKRYIEQLENVRGEWKEVKVDNLRKELYQNGFTITTITEDGEVITDKYVVYKRSSAKSRTGQCLFIKEHLHDEMINWSRMYLQLQEDMKIDYASLLAYESLVGSSIEDTIKINPNNILIVDDVESNFTQLANVVRKGDDGYLDSFTEEVEITNSIFDGESLLDAKYFEDGQSMKLLRNHMFKSAAFNTNIQEFIKDNCPDNVNYDEWLISDMFGNPILAKDIELIITPSSLKALKFSHVIGAERDMWTYWKSIIADEGSVFGVCKHEKASKLGYDFDNNILQQTSYQMLNSMPLQKDDLKQLTTFERDYIEKLKNDDDFFIEHIEKSANVVNSNEMFADLYKRNKDIVHTKVFRDFRKQQIKDHVNHVKKGKVRLVGDYCVMLGNGVEFLYHAIGKFDVNNPELTLKDNEVYTTLFDFGKELTGFRNPHTSPSNVLIAKNTYSKQIEKYFNLSVNVVVVNAVNFAIQDILSGCDYDSDNMMLSDNQDLLQVAKECYGKYLVCINEVESQKKQYRLNKQDMFVIDNQLSSSQKNIGEVVNLGQLCMSRYWDLINTGRKEETLLKKIDVMTVLSGIAIDMAKKFYELDIKKEINNVNKILELKKDKKPKFWVNVSQNKKIKNKVINYECPMDYLNGIMSNLDKADYKNNIELERLLIKQDARKANRKQKTKIADLIDEMKNQIEKVETKCSEDDDEKYNKLEDIINVCLGNVGKLKVKPDTMYDVLCRVEGDYSQFATRLMNALYQTQPKIFINAFKEK